MSAARSGQITVTTAGTAVQGPNEPGGEFLLAPNPANTGAFVWVGNDGAGDVASTNGYPLVGGVTQIVIRVNNLQDLWFDVQTNGDKICWLKVK